MLYNDYDKHRNKPSAGSASYSPASKTAASKGPAKSNSSNTPNKTNVVRLGRESKGRRGKGVTLVWDLPGSDDDIQQLAATLKNRCGTGGTVKDRIIEIQGDQRDRIQALLEELGFSVKRVGG
ncbi:MAG: translation initiation factor [Gemmataceae bacterium]